MVHEWSGLYGPIMLFLTSCMDAALRESTFGIFAGSPDCLYPCHNGGYCVDGYCDCPHPYTGPTCAIQICKDVRQITSYYLVYLCMLLLQLLAQALGS